MDFNSKGHYRLTAKTVSKQFPECRPTNKNLQTIGTLFFNVCLVGSRATLSARFENLFSSILRESIFEIGNQTNYHPTPFAP